MQTIPEIDLPRRLDLERTHIAYEQSMMSWIRTATSLITFGFTIYKFFQSGTAGPFREDAAVGASRVCGFTGWFRSGFTDSSNAGTSPEHAGAQKPMA
jgi:uncharacterized membrane protein YidH (DUF202 family)